MGNKDRETAQNAAPHNEWLNADGPQHTDPSTTENDEPATEAFAYDGDAYAEQRLYASPDPDDEDFDDEDEDEDDFDDDDDEDFDDEEGEEPGDWGHVDPAEGNSPFPDPNAPSGPGSAV